MSIKLLPFRAVFSTGAMGALAPVILRQSITVSPLLTYYTPPIAEVLCVKNGRAIVVCGFLMI